MRSLSRAVVAVLLSACFLGCAQHQLIDGSELLSHRRYLDAVPFYPQNDQQCGAAALATVLMYRNVNVSLSELESALFIPTKRGSLAVELHSQARQHGMVSYPLAPTLTALLSEIDAGNPVLIFQNFGFNWWPQYHFAVVVGYELESRELVLRSGTDPLKREAFRSFNNTWQRTGAWARVVVPAGVVPVTARPLPYLKAVTELEQLGKLAEARRGYLLAQQHWPEQVELQILAGIGLANIAYVEGRFVDAAAQLLNNVALAPDSATSWNNLAYVQLAQNCPAAALTAVRCAVALAPGNANFRHSLADISAAIASEQHPDHCATPACPAQ